MKKKNGDDILRDYLKLKNEMIRDKVDEIFRTQPDNYISALEEIGFTYYDDDDYEEVEEKKAKPENRDEQDLVDYFEGEAELTTATIDAFFRIKDAEEPNVPLIRKYFKQANQNLKALILHSLDLYPERHDLLFDLAYYHEFENMLSIVIEHFTRTCINEADLETFTELAELFDETTSPDGYEAFYALRDLFELGTDKRTVVDFLIQENEASQDDQSAIEF